MDDACKIILSKHLLDFNFPAGTSRGVLRQKKLWILELTYQGKTGKGECSVIEGLTPEFLDDSSYEKRLLEHITVLEKCTLSPKEILQDLLQILPELLYQPSMRCGLEMALFDWLSPIPEVIFDNAFARGKQAISINGLIWMGDHPWMQQQVERKIAEGYRILKFKIAALPWEEEWNLLKAVRDRFPADQLTLRVDANGGFQEPEVFERFMQLQSLDVHSIEQPVAPKHRALLKDLSEQNRVPVALDESLIDCYTSEQQQQILEEIKPQFIILKPSLHGGFSGVSIWIQLAEERGIGWWITSALESNIGLNAIAQFAGNYPLTLAQGLGTGGLFVDNFPTLLELKGPSLFHHLPEIGARDSQFE